MMVDRTLLANSSRVGDEPKGSPRACQCARRKLAGILFALWRDGTTFVVPERIFGTAA